MKNEKYTISDVAKIAGVSRSTVSRVLNDQPGVGAELRKKVLACIEEIGFKPNTLAKSLIKGHINIVALVFGDVRNPFYAELAFYIQKILNDNGYMVMAFNSEYDMKKEIEYIKMAVQFNFAGLILLTTQTQEMKETLQNVQLPVVLVNRTFDTFHGDTVSLDNFQAGYMATKHLISLGHSSFAFLAGPMNSSSVKQRYNGFLQAQNSYQIPFDPEKHVFSGNLKMETGYELAKKYVAHLRELPSAVVISNDLMAIGFIDYCQKNHVDIPGMLSIISFDNINLSDLHAIGLTTISQKAKQMSEYAAKLFLRRIQEPDAPPEHILIEPELIVRKTTSTYNPNRLDGWKSQDI